MQTKLITVKVELGHGPRTWRIQSIDGAYLSVAQVSWGFEYHRRRVHFFSLMPCALQGSDGQENVCGLVWNKTAKQSKKRKYNQV